MYIYQNIGFHFSVTADIAGVAEVEVGVPATDAAEDVESLFILEVVVESHDEPFGIVPPHRLQVLLDAMVVEGGIRQGLCGNDT